MRWLIALLILTVSMQVHAENRFGVAVVIGNKNYSGIAGVDYAHNDADAFRSYVVDVLGYDPDNIIDLRDATQTEMFATFGNRESHEGNLWSYLHPAGKSDVVVFYSGHGVPSLKTGHGYLLPGDADPNVPEINGYPIDLLYENLGKLKEAASIAVYLDACFSGASHAGMLIDAASPVFAAVETSEVSDARLTVLTAASEAQVASWDREAGHGLFTHHLLDALYGAADGDGDGRERTTGG